MEEVTNAIELSPWELWSQAIFWTVIGIALVKAIFYPYGAVKFWSWIKGRPILDVIRGILITLVVVKLGDVVIDIAKALGLDMSAMDKVFEKIGHKPVELSLVVAMFVQYKIYMWRKKKTAGPQIYGDAGITPPPWIVTGKHLW